MSEILLRIVEGARVALYRHDPSGPAENIPTRYDLFRYDGGYGWGYGGTGANSLSFALAAKLSELENLDAERIAERARRLLDGLISQLDGGLEYTLSVQALRDVYLQERSPA